MTQSLADQPRVGLIRPSLLANPRPGSDFTVGVDHVLATLASEVIGHYQAAVDARDRALRPDAEGQPPEVVEQLAAGHEAEARREHGHYQEGMAVLFRLVARLDAQCSSPGRYRRVYEEAFAATVQD